MRIPTHFSYLLGLFLLPLLMAQQAQKPTPPPMNTYAADWKSADSLMARGLPQSALVIADRVYADAKRTKNDPQLLKAAMRRVVFRTNAAKEEDTYLTLIRGLADDVKTTDGPTRAVLQSVLAEVYWQYFQQNRYKFYDRTATAPDAQTATADADIDPRTWDARRLQTTVNDLYTGSVNDAARLQQTPIGAYDAVINGGNAEGRTLRPTLFDVLAHRAIDFFDNTEAEVTKPIEAFSVNNPAYLGTPDVFLAQTLPATDPLSGVYQALRLYQQLGAFHKNDTDLLAFVVNDVARLTLMQQRGTLPNEADLLRETLVKQISIYKNKPAEAEYALMLAQVLAGTDQARPMYRGRYSGNTEGDPAPADSARRQDRRRAADLARDLIARFPKTIPGQQAKSLLNNLLRPSLGVQAEEANEPGKPFRARVSFQNVKTLYYKILRLTPDEARTLNQFDDYQNDPKRDNWFATLQNHAVMAQEQLTLPDDGDLHSHSVEIPVKALPLGYYVLLVSNEGKWTKPSSETAEIISIGTFAVSNLSYVLAGSAYQYDGGPKTFYITDRVAGQPLANVPVKLFTINDRREGVSLSNTYKTDANGKLTIAQSQMPSNRSFFLRISQNDDVLDTDAYYNYYNRRNPEDVQERRRATIFTDRAIYRPGQTVYWKVLLYEGADNQFRVVAGAKKTIRLTDVNGEEVTKTDVTTNEFGTATGTFTAPVGRLTGQMTISTDEGSAAVRVEEYKRPTFTVVADPLKQAVALGQNVPARAVAKTLAGAVVDGGKVAYRVTRTYFQPYWGWNWWRPSRPANEREIANGTAITDADGAVSFSFVAQPDQSIAATEKPQFTYTVTIDVTDPSGETRSATQSLRIGYTALTATLVLPDPVLTTDKKPYAVRLTNASDNEVGLKSGTVAIARLTPPRTGLRSRLWAKTDRNLLTREQYAAQFPHDLFGDDDNPATWAKTPVRTEPARAILLAGLAPGLYSAEVMAQDSTGQPAQQTLFFSVTDPQQPTAPVRIGEFVQAQKNTVQPGGEAVFWVGTSSASANRPDRILMAVEEKGKVVREEWLTVTGQPLRVVLPVLERHRGNFAVHFALVQNGRLLTSDQTITVPFTNKQLTIDTETFRDKLKPGQPEQWTLRIGGPQQDKILAEMVATLYDASLDAFARLEWPTNFYHQNSLSSTYWQSAAFGTQQTQQYWQPPVPGYEVGVRELPMLSWGPYQYIPYRGRFISVIVLEPLSVQIDRNNDMIFGRVLDEDGSKLAGVSVTIKGTSQGASSDGSGAFKLLIPKGRKKTVLIFSYTGYNNTEIDLGTKKSLLVILQPSSQSLQEVVVTGYGQLQGRAAGVAVSSAPMARAKLAVGGAEQDAMADASVAQSAKPDAPAPIAPAADPPVIRKNFNETAFFFPQLQTDKEGRVVLKFTMPEALTRWRLLTFAHTKNMQTGTLERDVVTQKELMVTTNVPRFFRENDTLRLTARIDNLSGKPLTGTATLQLTDAFTGESLNVKMGLTSTTQPFSAKAGQNALGTWTVVVPQNAPPVAIRVTAQTGESTRGMFTDGEERVVPVLPNRTLVTDAQPFWINGGDKDRTFRLAPLADLNPELPLNTERLTVEVTSNPAWYALQSLPYLMEYQYDCAEQLFSKVYANALGAHILNSRPQFRQVVDLWKQSPPKSPLMQNEELKAVTLENTPWLADAKSETERTAKLGQFFDQNRLAEEQRWAISKLRQLQDGSGGLTWFSGMRPSLNMTLHVLAGLGHLNKLGVSFDPGVQNDAAALQAGLIRFADAEIKREIAEEKRRVVQQKVASSPLYWAAQYLYARSFFLATNPVEKDVQAFLLPALSKGWQQQSLQAQALTVSTLYRYKLVSEARTILQSVTERSKISEELGMYWPDNQSGTYWYQAPVETQAYLIEAYAEVSAGGAAFAWYRRQPAFANADDQVFIDKMRQWLVQQKRTQSWPSTKATTEAIYALLLRGSDWLDTKATMTVRVGGKDIAARVTKTEALTGYQKVTYTPAEVTPALGTLTVSKSGKTGPSWGAMYWQHFEPLDAIAQSGNNLTVKKTIFRQRNTNAGPVLEPITAKTPLKPGDLLKVKVVLTSDRAMEYVHLKDGRASGFEPVTVLSGTKYQNGLAYYEAPRDASTDFFIEFLTPGTHVFEYALRVVHTGDFGSGLATVQCFYAPEFAAHSSCGRVRVK